MDWKRSFTTIARVSSTNGNEGQVVLSFLSFYPEDLNIEEPVFIYFDGLPVPFFISSPQPRGANKLIVSLTDIKSLKDAEELVGREVMVPYDEDTEDDMEGLKGWDVLNEDGQLVGKVEGFLDIPGNPCLELTSGAVIPAAEDLILEIDERKKTIRMSIPDGLL